MAVKEQIEQDLKAALLSGDKKKAMTLRGIKSVILYAEVASGSRDVGLDEKAILTLLQKEAKKRQESADLFARGGNKEKAGEELAEKALIETYLPDQLGEDEVSRLVDEVISDMEEVSTKDMGAVIAKVRSRSDGAADGALIARLVKERLAA